LQRPDGRHPDGMLRRKGGHIQQIGRMPLRGLFHCAVEFVPVSQQ
jgi:hypothetical protein